MNEIRANVFFVGGERVLCGAIGNGAGNEENCISVWEQIPDQEEGINRGFVAAAKRRWPELSANDEGILLAWPPPQLRAFRRTVLSLMADSPTHVVINRVPGAGPSLSMTVEERSGGRVVGVSLIHSGWSETP